MKARDLLLQVRACATEGLERGSTAWQAVPDSVGTSLCGIFYAMARQGKYSIYIVGGKVMARSDILKSGSRVQLRARSHARRERASAWRIRTVRTQLQFLQYLAESPSAAKASCVSGNY
jgi:hypothetical protein